MTWVAALTGGQCSSSYLKKPSGERSKHHPKVRMLLKRRYDGPLLAEIVPSRWDDEPNVRAQSALSGLAGTGGFSLEFVASDGRLRFYVRTRSDEIKRRVQGHLTSAYPQADFREVPITSHPDLDPAWRSPGEEKIGVQLRPRSGH